MFEFYETGKQVRKVSALLTAVALISVTNAACGEDKSTKESSGRDCQSGQRFNPVTGCVSEAPDDSPDTLTDETSSTADIAEQTSSSDASDTDVRDVKSRDTTDTRDMSDSEDEDVEPPSPDRRWDVQLQSLYEPGSGCSLPDCSESSDTPVNINISKNWDWSRKTTKSTCGTLVKQNDPRTKEGHQFSGSTSFGSLNGTCIRNDSGEHIGTVKHDTLALCTKTEKRRGVVAFRAEVSTFSDSQGEGTIKQFLTGIPSIAGGDCKVTWDVDYQ